MVGIGRSSGAGSARAGSFALLVSLACLATVRTAAAEPVDLSPVAQAGYGLFLDYCAACHGVDAGGNGPAASALRTPPPDLTAIAERRDGHFPAEELLEFIDGRTMTPSHGAREMPIWGDRFDLADGDGTLAERRARGRLRMILVYLEAVQR